LYHKSNSSVKSAISGYITNNTLLVFFYSFAPLRAAFALLAAFFAAFAPFNAALPSAAFSLQNLTIKHNEKRL